MVVSGYWEVTKSNQDGFRAGGGCGRSPHYILISATGANFFFGALRLEIHVKLSMCSSGRLQTLCSSGNAKWCSRNVLQGNHERAPGQPNSADPLPDKLKSMETPCLLKMTFFQKFKMLTLRGGLCFCWRFWKYRKCMEKWRVSVYVTQGLTGHVVI